MPLTTHPLTIRSHVHDAVAVLELAGKIMGTSDADRLRAAIDACLAEGRRGILLDFAGVPWVNSQGVGVLMSCLTTLRPAGAVLKLLGVNDRVKSVLDVTRLSSHFEFFTDEAAAIASFGETAPPPRS